eukprot:6190473-Pyramimonas_sp.AAC.1
MGNLSKGILACLPLRRPSLATFAAQPRSQKRFHGRIWRTRVRRMSRTRMMMMLVAMMILMLRLMLMMMMTM